MFRSGTAGLLWLLGHASLAALAQGPVVLQRGALNAVTLEPALSRVAPGDILALRGLNLGPVEEVKAGQTPLPNLLAGVEVSIAGRPAPIFSVSSGLIRVQVPRQIPAGLVNVIVKRGEAESRPVLVNVVASAVAVITKNAQGFGEAGRLEGRQLLLSATGLGVTEAPVPPGQPGAEDGTSVPRRPVRAFVGGLPARVTAALSPTRVAEFDVTIDLPEGALPGDIVTLSNGTAPVMRPSFGASAAQAEVHYQRLPNALRNLRSFRSSDLRGEYIVANGARAEDGCFPTWIFDMPRGVNRRVEPCLLAPANAVSPVNPVNESSVLASFAGPASDGANLISATVVLFNPAREDLMKVELPGPAAVLNSLADGSVTAIGGEKPYSINTDSGEVSELAAANPGGAGGAGGVGAGQVGGALIALDLDLGEGLTSILSGPVTVAPGVTVVVVGNDANKPTRAKLALLGAGFTVSETRDFPESWLPLIPPLQQAPGGGNNPALQARRLPTFFDAASRTFFALSTKADGSTQGFVSFTGVEQTPKAIPFPEGWFAATCAPNLSLFNLQLSGRLAIFGSRRRHDAVLAACTAQGYLSLNLAGQTISAVPLPGVGEVNTRAANGDVNDYLFASNTDSQNSTLSDTLFIFDSVSGSPFRLDLPPGIVGFQQIVPVPFLNGLVATAIATRIAGDGGLIFFDLETEKTTVFPVPEGFTSVSYVAVFPNTRKLVARGVKADATQYLIYDLVDGDLVMPANPEGVAYVGPLPVAAAQPGAGGGAPGGPQGQAQVQAQVVNTKANSIAALAYDSIRNLVGIVTIKVP